MVSFVRPGLLGESKEFKDQFELPIVEGQRKDADDEAYVTMGRKLKELDLLLRGTVHRHTTMIPKTEYTVVCCLTPLQQELYNT